MTLAVIKTGGKQYLVSPGQKIKIEKIEKKAGEEVIFNEVLLLQKGKIEIGQPRIKDAKVIAKVIKQGKAKKIIVFKYKPKTRYKVKKGHRQLYTEIEIKEIQMPKSK